MTEQELQISIERRRRLFHWFIDGLGSFHYCPDNRAVWISRHGLYMYHYKHLTPEFITEHFNVNLL